MSSKVKVLVGHGDLLMAEGLRHILEAEFEVVDVVTDQASLVEMAPRGSDVVVLNLPGDALALTAELRQVAPDAGAVLLNQPADSERCMETVAAGAKGYLLHGADPAELIFAVRAVANKGVYVSTSMTGEVLRRQTAAPPSEPAPAPRTGESIRVVIADDNCVIREGLRAMLTAAGVEVSAMAEDGRQAVDLALRHRPDVVLMDLMMPEMDGVQAIRALVSRWPTVRILIISSFQSPERILPAVQAGARGYVSKQLDRDEYLAALTRVHRGELSFPDDIVRHEPPPSLTRREREVVRLAAAGLENQEIASKLFISVVTVRTHVRNVMDKLGIANRVEIVLHALRSGLVTLEDLAEVPEVHWPDR